MIEEGLAEVHGLVVNRICTVRSTSFADLFRRYGALWAAVGFPSPHDSTPAVITQVQSTNDPAWVKTRQQNSSSTGSQAVQVR